MAGLVPAIHETHVDHRDKAGDDERRRMGWFQRWQMRRAAKQYAHRLGPHLRHAYGASEHYSVGQIRAGVGQLGLKPKFIVFGYAACLREAEYYAAASMAPLHLPFEEARELFERFRPSRLVGSASFYESWGGGQGLSGGGNQPGGGSS